MRAAAAAWDWSCTGGTADECATLALAALADGSLVANDPGFFTPVAAATLIMADRPEVLELWETTQAEAHRRGSLFAMIGVNLWRGLTLLQRGDLEDAEESLLAGFDRTNVFGTDRSTAGAYSVGFLTRVYVEQGKLAEARALDQVHVYARDGADGDLYRRRGQIELLLAEDRPEEAAAEADALGAVLGRVTNPAVAPWRTLKALALDRLGRTEEAIALAEKELALARHWGAPASLSHALRILGTLERDRGMAHLEEAVAVAEGTPARLEHAKALAALGSAIRRDRRPSESREPLRRALELAESCSATPLMDFARGELHASGARPRTSALGGVESLTPSERRVADLALGGQTNRDIAQTLYVTPKTVEVHLSNAYRKLGIRSRRELPAALG
jgi:DNA-binding CsgD family transcriptional regulator